MTIDWISKICTNKWEYECDFKECWAPLCSVCIIEWCAFRTYCHFIRKWNVYSSTILINTFRTRSIKRIFYSLYKYLCRLKKHASSKCENRLTHIRPMLMIHQLVSYSKVVKVIFCYVLYWCFNLTKAIFSCVRLSCSEKV